MHPGAVKATPGDLRQFHYFRAIVAAQGDEFNSSLYGVGILQSAHICPPIWHACLTESAIHQRASIVAKAPKQTTETALLHVVALHQHGHSLRHIIALSRQRELSPLDKDVIAAANALFIRTTIRCGQLANTVRYLSHGIKLINQWELWDPAVSSPVIPSTSLLLFHAQLSSLLVDVGPPAPWPWRRALACLQTRPLLSLDEVCLEFELIWTGIRSVLRQTSGRAKSRERLRPYFEAFNARFDEYALQGRDRCEVSALQMRREFMDVLFRVDFDGLEMSWDGFASQFERIVAYTEGVFAQRGDEAKDVMASPTVVAMMQYMARICRQPKLRRRIIAVMGQQKRWIPSAAEVLLCAGVTDAILAIEETQCASRSGKCVCVSGKFVCHGHRIAELDISFDGKDLADLLYRTEADVAAGCQYRRCQIGLNP